MDPEEVEQKLKDLEEALSDEVDAASRASSIMEELEAEGIDHSDISSRFL